MNEQKTIPYIGERIQSLRKQKHLSREALATSSGLSVSSIRRFEAGTRAPRTTDLVKLAEGLKITVEELQKGVIFDTSIDGEGLQKGLQKLGEAIRTATETSVMALPQMTEPLKTIIAQSTLQSVVQYRKAMTDVVNKLGIAILEKNYRLLNDNGRDLLLHYSEECLKNPDLQDEEAIRKYNESVSDGSVPVAVPPEDEKP